jgi:polyisoprenoid-binding protein YceI
MADITLKQHDKINTKGMVRGLIAVALIGIIIASFSIAYIWFLGGDGQASASIVAPQLTALPDDSRVLFHIVPDESEVQFRIDEVLLGRPKTVIGITDQVAGDFLVDFETPANSQIGVIRINVRTLKTDNEFRNRALRSQILEADRDEFEYAELIITELIDLPNVINIGETINFQISGDLTVHGVSHSVIFDSGVNVISSTRLEGIASATVYYSDFDITIPEASGVANISDELHLKIDFIADTTTPTT